jgi:adenosyl cobinamide kinase/adenosyl cobinamide phosphate guanylyltransferase
LRDTLSRSARELTEEEIATFDIDQLVVTDYGSDAIFRGQYRWTIVAKYLDIIVGFVDYDTVDGEDVAYIVEVMVADSLRRKKIATKMYDYIKSKGLSISTFGNVRTPEGDMFRQFYDNRQNDISDNDDRHKAPYRDDEGFFSPAHDVSKAFPGIYSMSFSKALREYGTGNDSDPMAVQIIRNIQDNPDAKVKIYRAVEKGLQDNIADLKQDRKYIKRNGSVPPWADVPPHSAEEYSAFVDSQIDNLGSVEGATIQPSINANEWVTITRQYAVDHGECCVPGGYTILTKTVKAKDLFTEGNSIHEWGYDPGNDTGLRDQSFMPPKEVQEEAERGLEWRREYNRGGTSVGVARARDLSNGKSVSYDTVKRMKAYFDRHSVDKDAQGFRQGEPGYPSAGRIAWALWGGDAGYRWSKSIVSKQGLGEIDSNDQLSGKVLDTQEKEQSKEVAPLTTQEVINMDPPQTLPLKGELRDFLSSLLAKFNMLIWGGAGSGKSSFVLRLANELAETNTGRVLYFMTEEKVSSGRLKARMDLMKAYSDNVNFDDQGTFDRLTALVNTGMYRYVIVDSINMINIEQTKIVELMQTFPEVSWIFIAQATKGKNAYAGIQSLAHAVDTEIATANDKGTAVAELKKHRDGALKTHTIFGNAGVRDPKWQAQW